MTKREKGGNIVKRSEDRRKNLVKRAGPQQEFEKLLKKGIDKKGLLW